MRDKLLKLLKPEASTDVKLSVVSLFLAKMLESFEPRIQSLEERQLQKGDKGDKGDRGDVGPKGEKGDIGPQGLQGLQGIQGKDGKNGKDGKQGKEGVSVVDVKIDIDDHLVCKLSNGKEIDAGELPSAKDMMKVFTSGNGYQITVSSTPPSNPQTNDLWLQI